MPRRAAQVRRVKSEKNVQSSVKDSKTQEENQLTKNIDTENWKAIYSKKTKTTFINETKLTFFMKAETGQLNVMKQDEVEELFDSIDPDNNGSIHPKRLREVLTLNVPDGQYRKDLLGALLTTPIEIEDGKVTAESFYQSLLLGSSDDAGRMVTRIKGFPTNSTWIFRDTLIEHLRVREEAAENCKSLPLTLLFFAVFFYLVTEHLQIDAAYDLTNAVSDDVKTAYLRNRYPHSFWSLMSKNAGAARISWNNEVVGGLRISQVPEDGEPLGRLCPYATMDFLGELITTAGKNSLEPKPLETCYDPLKLNSWIHWSLNKKDALSHFNTGFGRNITNAEAEAVINIAAAEGETYFKGQPVEPYGSEDDSIWLARPAWTNKTSRLQYQVLTYNPQLNHYTYMKVKFIRQKSGSILAKQHVEAISRQPIWLNIAEDLKLNRQVPMALDLVFLAIFLWNGLCEIFEIFHIIYYKGCRGGLKMYFSSIWNIVDWFNVFMVTFIVIVYFHSNYLVSGLNQLYTQLPKLDDWHRYTPEDLSALVPGGIGEYEARLNDVIEQAERVVFVYYDLKWYISLFAFSSGLKFLKAFRANPKLNVVTQTVYKASSDLVHFLVVLVAILMAFVLVAHILFGSQMNAFITPGETLDTCFVITLGYKFDDLSAEMFDVGSHLGLIWVWLYNVGFFIILLNMVLAIIFDVYSEVKEGAGESMTLPAQTIAMLQDKRKRANKIKEYKGVIAEEEAALQTVRNTFIQQDDMEEESEEDISPNADEVEEERLPEEDENTHVQKGSLDSPHPIDAWMPVEGSTGSDSEPKKEAKNKKGGAGLRISAVKPVRKAEFEEPDPERNDSKGSSDKKKGLIDQIHATEAVLVNAGKHQIQNAAHEAEMVGKIFEESVQETLGIGWTEAKLYDALCIQELHDQDVVTVESLMKALNAHGSEAAFMRYVLESAKEKSKTEEEVANMSLTDKIRMMGRIDLNVRGLVPSWVGSNVLALEDADAVAKAKNFAIMQERFGRIEDAVFGLTHKLHSLERTAQPQDYSGWPPGGRKKEIAWV